VLTDGCFAVPTQTGLRAGLQTELLALHPYRPVPPGVEALAAG